MPLLELNWRPSTKDLRIFAVLQLAFCGLVAWSIDRRFDASRTAVAIAGISAAVAMLGCLLPNLLRPLYVAWLAVTFPIGWVVSHVVMAKIFFVIITPIGLLMKLVGREPLSRPIDRDAESYWQRRPESVDSQRYFRQF